MRHINVRQVWKHPRRWSRSSKYACFRRAIAAVGLLLLSLSVLGHFGDERPGTMLAAQVSNKQAKPVARDGDGKKIPPAGQGMPKAFEKVVAVSLDTKPIRTDVRGSLIRELARQSFLIAARDEFGLATLDLSMGETIPVGTAVPGPFLVSTAGLKKNQNSPNDATDSVYDFTVTISRTELNGQPLVWSSPQFAIRDSDIYESLVEHVEVMSRGPFIEFLQKAGFKKAKPASGPASKSTVKLDYRLDFVSQFALIRALHTQVSSGAESQETLEGLVRAYANLGSLTAFHWSPASKGFRARSLLYAQRLIVKHGTTPSSLAHRAYAQALAGRHGAALDAIRAAREAKGTKTPDWLGLIEAYCDYSPEKLEQATGVDRELALYLRMKMVDFKNDASGSVGAILQVLKVNPACCHAADFLMEIPELGIQRTATVIGFDEMWPHVYQRLATLSDLPAAAKKVADSAKGRKADPRSEYLNRKELVGHLLATAVPNDPSGLSWVVLGSLLRDVSSSQAFRILNMEANTLSIDSRPSYKRLKPLIQGHPFERFLESFSVSRSEASPILRKFGPTIDRYFVEVTAVPMALELYNHLDSAEGDTVTFKIHLNTDRILEDAVGSSAVQFNARDQQNLLRISPHWPVSIAKEIGQNPSASLIELEEKYRRSVTVLMPLYHRYCDEKQPADALRCLMKAVEAAPSSHLYLELAQFHHEQGDYDLWKEALEKGLTLPNLGLDHAEIHTQLASRLLEQEKWSEAKSHAMTAAKSFSAMGLLVASHYEERVENWEESEKYQRVISSRYESSATSWYYWCIRTGRGNQKEARAVADRYLDSLPRPLKLDRTWFVAVRSLVDGKQNDAIALLRNLFKSQQNTVSGAYAAVLADESHANEVRDTLFAEVEKVAQFNDSMVELINSFRGVLAGTEQGRWNPVIFESLAVSTPEMNIPFIYLIAGQFLLNHGHQELGESYLQCAATSNQVSNLASVVAADVLRKRNIAVGKSRSNGLPDSLVPLFEMQKKGALLRMKGQLRESEAVLTELVKRRPDFLTGLLALGSTYEALEKYPDAIANYELIIRNYPSSPLGYNRLARLLATCPKDAIRNGPKAVEIAGRSVSLRPLPNSASLSSLAMAHAECGQFDKAIELEKQARGLPGRDPEHNRRIATYLSHRPYRVRARGSAETAADEPGIVRSWRGSLGRSQFGVFSQDGSRLVYAIDNDIVIVDSETGANAVKLLGHTKPVWAARYSDDDRQVVSIGQDETVRVWDVTTRMQISEISGKTSELCTVLQPTKTADLVAFSFGQDRSLAIVNAVSKAEVRRINLTENEVWWRSTTRDLKWGMSNGIRKETKIWDLSTGSSFDLNNGHHNYCGQFTHNGKRALFGGDFTWDLWDLQSKSKTKSGQVTGGHVYAVATSPVSGRFMTGLADGSIWLWEESVAREVMVLRGHEKPLVAVMMSPDNRLAISQDNSGNIKLWRLPK